MILIGEKINGSIPSVAKAIAEKNEDWIRNLARIQTEAGADYIDVCASVKDNEIEALQWLIGLVQEVSDTPICIDSPDAAVCVEAMKFCKKPGLINSVSMGTVAGDLHDIGKNLVIMMIESTGYEVIDLGIDVPVEKFLEVASDPEITVMGVSALLTTTMPAMQETVAALNKHPRRSAFKIMVGGAPITQAFADEIGADIYTEDAASAGQAAKALAAG